MSNTALQSIANQLETDVAALITQNAGSVPQAEVDTITAQLTTVDQSVQAALAPATTPTPTPAPTA